ncbi:hypothetical protein Q7P37_010244 [Cladosporium fusiforme]
MTDHPVLMLHSKPDYILFDESAAALSSDFTVPLAVWLHPKNMPKMSSSTTEPTAVSCTVNDFFNPLRKHFEGDHQRYRIGVDVVLSEFETAEGDTSPFNREEAKLVVCLLDRMLRFQPESPDTRRLRAHGISVVTPHSAQRTNIIRNDSRMQVAAQAQADIFVPKRAALTSHSTHRVYLHYFFPPSRTMAYSSEIQFTLDTICPWTYLAKRRLTRALASLPADCPVDFTIIFKPYQLFPEASQEGEGKYEWYKRAKYGESEEKMQMYMVLMTAYGETENIKYKFGGTVANTLHAHRLIQHFQESKGSDVANALVDSLYRQYFEEEKHPSSTETLVAAASEAGIDEKEAKAFIEDESEGLVKVKMDVREQAGNGIDSVPYVVLEGKKRDITLVGCKEVDEYRKALEQIVKEFLAMESLLSLAFDNISSVDATKIRKGLRQIEGLLAQLCLSSAPARSPRKGGDGMAEAKGLGVLREDAAFREFFRLQEGFRCNVVSRLIATLERLLGMPGTAENDIVILSALELLQGMLLLHPPSRSLFSREIYLNVLLDLLDSANPPALQSQTLLVLLTVMLECPRNARTFENMEGLLTVASLLKSRGTAKDVRVRAMEFLSFYLMPEATAASEEREDIDTATVQRIPNKSAGGLASHSRTSSNESGSSMDVDDEMGTTRSTEEKKAYLERWLGNVDWLVQDLPGGVPINAAGG